jgi:pyruvate/2-oxoglutarate dehydrogenase complex dihydrolipoamide acyltransferase (E2) component
MQGDLPGPIGQTDGEEHVLVEVIMPKQGMYEDDVTLIEWLAADGAAVAVGDPLFVMGTEKVDTEIEAEDSGVLVHLQHADFIGPIGTVIGLIASDVDEAERARASRQQ